MCVCGRWYATAQDIGAGAKGQCIGLEWRMPQRAGWRRMSRGGLERLLLMQVWEPLLLCPSSLTLASGHSGGGRIFPGTDVLHVPKDKW